MKMLKILLIILLEMMSIILSKRFNTTLDFDVDDVTTESVTYKKLTITLCSTTCLRFKCPYFHYEGQFNFRFLLSLLFYIEFTIIDFHCYFTLNLQ